MSGSVRRLAAVFLAAAATASPAAAQTVSQIVATVNRESISLHDLENRMRLLNLGARLPEAGEARRRVVEDVLRGLINERLQLQEARRLRVEVPNAELAEALRNIEQRNRMPSGGLFKALQQRNIDPKTLVDQVQASLAWGKVVQALIRPQIRVSDEEVSDVLKRLTANKEKLQYRVFEIYLPIDRAGAEAATLRLAQTVMDQLRRGTPFDIMARQYSQSGTAAAGGDMGFIFEGQLDRELENVVRGLKTGQIAGPVRGLGGYFIVLLADKRNFVGANPDLRTVAVAQAVFNADPRKTGDLQAAQTKARALVRDAKNCDDFVKAARAAGAQAQVADDVALERLPPQLRTIIGALKPNQASQPLTAGNEVVALMRCEGRTRTEPGAAEIRETLSRQKVNAAAERYLRELRRSATVDIRI
jgi:peptidyl-prolyl cis-trans isomerase SurA